MTKVTEVQSMTVGELKQYLDNFDDDLPVVFSHWFIRQNGYNEIALREVDDVNEDVVIWSDEDQEFISSNEDSGIPVVILS